MKRLLAIVCAFSVFTAVAQVPAPSSTPLRQLHDIGIDQRLGAQVPLDIPFRNEDGSSIELRSLFANHPVLLIPVYYTCPMLCSQILSGVVAGLRPVSLVPGRDFEVVAFSFNPTETPKDASAARARYTRCIRAGRAPRVGTF